VESNDPLLGQNVLYIGTFDFNTNTQEASFAYDTTTARDHGESKAFHKNKSAKNRF
jgi:hypothetical protein